MLSQGRGSEGTLGQALTPGTQLELGLGLMLGLGLGLGLELGLRALGFGLQCLAASWAASIP